MSVVRGIDNGSIFFKIWRDQLLYKIDLTRIFRGQLRKLPKYTSTKRDLRTSLGEMARDILIFPCQVMIIFSKINLDDNKNEF